MCTRHLTSLRCTPDFEHKVKETSISTDLALAACLQEGNACLVKRGRFFQLNYYQTSKQRSNLSVFSNNKKRKK